MWQEYRWKCSYCKFWCTSYKNTKTIFLQGLIYEINLITLRNHITQLQLITEFSEIVAKYSPFSKVHVAGFQVEPFLET